MDVELILVLALAMSMLAIRLAMPVAARVGLVDRPGGHKQHDDHVPLVGGLGIYAALLTVLGLALLMESRAQPFYGSLLVGASLLFLVGLIDDMFNLGVRVRFIAQGIAASITALWGGVILNDFGALVTSDVLVLGAFALPVTIFATAGVINALNMSDGIDGLSGSLSAVSLVLLAVIAFLGGADAYLNVILAMLGAVIGFLVFNMRCCGRKRAKTFMGDAGSTMLGFLFACLFVGLSQGEARAMTPVTALWFFAVPLYDTTATMIRRMWLAKSPFSADRWHLHHLLLDAGFTVPQGVAALSGLQLLLGFIGLAGWYYGVPERAMFGGFIGLFVLYLYLVSRPWRFVPAMRQVHRNLDLPVAGVGSVFVGNLPQDSAEETLRKILAEYLDDYGYELYAQHDSSGLAFNFAIVHIGSERTTTRVVNRLRGRLAGGESIVVRQLIPRQPRHDRRIASRDSLQQRRRADRRRGDAHPIARHTANTHVNPPAIDSGRIPGLVAATAGPAGHEENRRHEPNA